MDWGEEQAENDTQSRGRNSPSPEKKEDTQFEGRDRESHSPEVNTSLKSHGDECLKKRKRTKKEAALYDGLYEARQGKRRRRNK